MTTTDYHSDDDFATDEDDKIRLYGSTSDSLQRGPKIRPRDIINFPDGTDERGVTFSAGDNANGIDGTTDRQESNIPLQDFQVHGQGQNSPLLHKDKLKLKHHTYPGLHGAPSNHSLATTWSSETVVSTKSFGSYDNWLRHPKVRENWRVVLGSIALTIVGVALIVSGIGVLISANRGIHCIVFFIIGLLCLIPGVYHLVIIIFAVQGRPGYTFYNIPTFK
ncbi:hypothetical protein LOTGIDRAFT_231584 [Lottia gigantea]|uniref:Transmembrane protein 134 n=1 Tax=Lottia gigantea TaxID=225164 RepID=V4ARH3_LOTGI|nr:hypothetical protein LOTGIDRAFT_231584 [Lottia gigantea]ESO97415.1 hypothetical protein LOTGIDRAFT_231584 [Lottia gigantea]